MNMVEEGKTEFSVNFWIRLKENPNWGDASSTIRFPPLNAPESAMVVCMKYGSEFRSFVLHPTLRWRKLVTDVREQLSKDAMVTIVVSGESSKLYLNAKEKAVLTHPSDPGELQVGDAVLVQLEANDVKGLEIGPGTAFPAVVHDLSEDNAKLFVVGINAQATVPRSRIMF